MRPNMGFVHRDGTVGFESNEVGLKGDPLDSRRKLVVLWGDSVAFGVNRGWAHLLDDLAPGYQFLNGGLEGDLYTNILQRAREFNAKHEVALNLLMLGWHPFVPQRIVSPRRSPFAFARRTPVLLPHSGNERVCEELTRFLEQWPNTVVLTMPTALNRRIVDQDLSSYLIDSHDETQFTFLGHIPYQLEGQRHGFEHIVERNAITREVCATLGVRIVDLFAVFDTEHQADSATTSTIYCMSVRNPIRSWRGSCTRVLRTCLFSARLRRLAKRHFEPAPPRTASGSQRYDKSWLGLPDLGALQAPLVHFEIFRLDKDAGHFRELGFDAALDIGDRLLDLLGRNRVVEIEAERCQDLFRSEMHRQHLVDAMTPGAARAIRSMPCRTSG